MDKQVIPISVQAVVPTNTGSAVFLGNQEKTFVIYVEPTVGNAISMFINGTPKERPLTHDLMAMVLQAFGARVDHVVINDCRNATYFGRLILTAENELMRRKVVELDARPSDCIAMACQQGAPIFVSRPVWEEAEDMSPVLAKLGQGKLQEAQAAAAPAPEETQPEEPGDPEPEEGGGDEEGGEAGGEDDGY